MKELDGTKKDIVVELQKEQDLWPNELARRVDKSNRTVKDHLDEMNDMGIVSYHNMQVDYNDVIAYRLIDENIDTKYMWENYYPDFLGVLFASTVIIIGWFITKSYELIFGYLPPITVMVSLILYRLFRYGDNKEVYIEAV